VRVLMLGWEFPPHISGGLGTACKGLTEGLASQGVEILFVVPRLFGDEDATQARLVGCADVVPSGRGSAQAPAAAPAADAPRRAAAPPTPAARALEVVAVASPLAPYQTPGTYRETLREPAERSPRQELLSGQSRAVARLLGESLPGGRQPFSGQYGQDLMSEVARYAHVVADLARGERFDVVHAHDWLTFPAGLCAAEASGRPFIAHVHACEYDRSGEHPNREIREIERLGLAAADRVIAVSHYTASILAARYGVDPAKLRVVHNATLHRPRGREAGCKAIDERIVLFLGRVTFQKGPDYFLEMARRVVDVVPQVKFVIAGTGDMLAPLIERAAAIGLARHVHFTGFLHGPAVERMYSMADVYVMPSVSEPFGIAALEALALDVPVILSRQSGVAEVLPHMLKSDFWDVEDMASKLIALLRHPSLRESVVRAGRAELDRIQWTQRGALVHEVYKELVQ
jgi:glycosyltransferase involved in cell wall biosynthesis